MGRLIDADRFIKEVAKYFIQPNYHPDADAFLALEAEKHNDYIKGFIDEIESQPTAYDVDAVVEQLEKWQLQSDDGLIAVGVVLNIVKGAVKDESSNISM